MQTYHDMLEEYGLGLAKQSASPATRFAALVRENARLPTRHDAGYL